MAAIYVVELRLDDRTDPFWELSKSVPRDADGEPVESGSLGFDGSYYGDVIGQVTSIEGAIHLLKGRTEHDIRVSEVTRAYEAAQARGPSSERRVKARPRTAQAAKAVRSSTGNAGEPTKYRGAKGAARSARFAVFMLILLLLITLAYVFAGDALKASGF